MPVGTPGANPLPDWLATIGRGAERRDLLGAVRSRPDEGSPSSCGVRRSVVSKTPIRLPHGPHFLFM
jgi:hypothetical protein